MFFIKNFLILVAFGFFSVATFAGNGSLNVESELLNKNLIQTEKSLLSETQTDDDILFKKPIDVYCDGVLSGTIDCPTCTPIQLANISSAMCEILEP